MWDNRPRPGSPRSATTRLQHERRCGDQPRNRLGAPTTWPVQNNKEYVPKLYYGTRPSSVRAVP